MSLRNKNANPTVANDQLPSADLMDSLFAGSQVSVYPMGESFTGATTPQPAKIVNDLVQPLYTTVSTFGSAGTPYRSLKFKPQKAVTVASVRTLLTLATDPSTNLSIEIQTDSAGVPSGSAVTNGTSATIATSTLVVSSYRFFNFTFSTPPTLSANTTYHVVIKVSATNANTISIPTLANANKYCNFDGGSYNGTSWSSGQVLPYFEIVPSTVGSYSLWRSDGDGVEPLNMCDGFVVTTGSANADGVIIRGGTVQGFSGLVPNGNYSVSNTIGTITLAENEGMYIARALNATDIEIAKTKFGPRNNYTYTTMTVYSSTYQGVPIYAYDNGYIVVNGNASPKNATVLLLSATVTNSNTNASNPASIGGRNYYITAGVSNANSPCYGMAIIPVKKGDRVQISTGGFSGAGTDPAINEIHFQPVD